MPVALGIASNGGLAQRQYATDHEFSVLPDWVSEWCFKGYGKPPLSPKLLGYFPYFSSA